MRCKRKKKIIVFSTTLVREKNIIQWVCKNDNLLSGSKTNISSRLHVLLCVCFLSQALDCLCSECTRNKNHHAFSSRPYTSNKNLQAASIFRPAKRFFFSLLQKQIFGEPLWLKCLVNYPRSGWF